MAKVVLSLEGEIVDQRVLGSSRLLLGRAPECDLVIESPHISQHHAQITTAVHDHFIEDLRSTNGTVVNGRVVDRHLLQNGDVVFLGDYRLKYLNAASAGLGFDRTQLLEAGLALGLESSAGPADARLDVASLAARAARARMARGFIEHLVAEGRGDAPREIERLLLPLHEAGRCIAVINRRPNGCFLSRVNERANLRLNQRKLGKEPVLLGEGDRIEAGTQTLIFHLPGN